MGGGDSISAAAAQRALLDSYAQHEVGQAASVVLVVVMLVLTAFSVGSGQQPQAAGQRAGSAGGREGGLSEAVRPIQRDARAARRRGDMLHVFMYVCMYGGVLTSVCLSVCRQAGKGKPQQKAKGPAAAELEEQLRFSSHAVSRPPLPDAPVPPMP